MRIVFFGTSPFAAEVLNFLRQQHGCDIVAVVTRPDRPRGRSLEILPAPVKAKALAIGLSCPIFQPPKASTDEFAATLKSLDPDLFVVVAYGEIIKQSLLSLPNRYCINIHASLLPKYRGAAPIQRAIMQGEKETGITMIEMVQGMDAGPMLKKKAVPIGENTTFGELEKDLLNAACQAVLETIRDIEKGAVAKEEQDHTQMTLASKLQPEDEIIDWQMPASAIHNQIRALSPFPGAWCKAIIGQSERRLKIKRTMVRSDLNGDPGVVLERSKGSLIIACGQGSLQLLEVQMEGKKAMPVQEFLQGLQQSLSFQHR